MYMYIHVYQTSFQQHQHALSVSPAMFDPAMARARLLQGSNVEQALAKIASSICHGRAIAAMDIIIWISCGKPMENPWKTHGR